MLLIGLTGGIGSGKTFISKIINSYKKFKIFDSDFEAKKIIKNNPEVISSIKNRSKEDMEKILNAGESILMKPALPEYISSVIYFLLSDQSKYISGQVIRVDGGQFTSPI